MDPTSTPVAIIVSNGKTVAAAVGATIVGGALGGFVMAPSGALFPIAAGQTAVLSVASGAGAAGTPEYELDPVKDKEPDVPESIPDNKPNPSKTLGIPTATPTDLKSHEPETVSGTYESLATSFWTSASWTSSTIPYTTSSASITTQSGFSTSTQSSSKFKAPTSTSSATPQETSIPINWINHDKIVAFTQKASPGLEGQLELRFNPFLYVSGGCDPYPAVDANGNVGSGLKPTGGGRSGCGGGGNGQVYVRRGRSQGRTGIMYSYYFPKVRWNKGNNGGHRHYWASVVVWIDHWGCDDDATAVWPLGVSFTADHLTWGAAKDGEISFKASTVGVDMPTHAMMQIHDDAMAPFTGADSSAVFDRTLVGWQSLPDIAQKGLNNVNYETAQVPFSDANFQANLDAAYRDSFFSGVPVDRGCSK